MPAFDRFILYITGWHTEGRRSIQGPDTEEDTQFRIHFKSVKKVEIKSSPNVLAVHGCLFFTSALCYFECKRNFFLLKNTPVGDFEEILYLIIKS